MAALAEALAGTLGASPSDAVPATLTGSLSGALPLALLCGLVLGMGLWVLLALIPPLNRPRLASRVAPYVADVSEGARDFLGRRAQDPLPVLGLLAAPLLSRLAAVVGRVLGGDETVRRRLRQGGIERSVGQHRARQALGGLVGAAAGVLFTAVAGAVRDVAAPLPVFIPVLCGAGAVFAVDVLLQRAARARLGRLQEELPTVLEFLTLSISAGEGVFDALRRVTAIGTGELSRELATVVVRVGTGVPLVPALQQLARELELPSLSRCIEQLTGAIERGTPLAEVLRAQANDARDQAKRELLEASGKKEVAMLLPLVFLILPVTVLFAIFPGIMVLQVGF